MSKQSEHYRRKQLEALKLLGNKCARCGFDDPRALQIDHINGDGYLECDGKGNRGKTLHNYGEILKGSTRFQLLCANCNWIKKHENKEHSNRGWKLLKAQLDRKIAYEMRKIVELQIEAGIL